MLTKQKITDRIWAIYSDTQEEIGKGFVRFQEFYENKHLKGDVSITVKKVEDWWAANRDEEITDPYYTYWAGFNIPGKVILRLLTSPKFRVGFSSYPWWHEEEDQFLELLQDITIDEIYDGYFIGLCKASTDVLDHEVAHALFATNGLYKAEQTYNLSQLPKDIYAKIRDDLIASGYHPHVVYDEIQAYLSTYPDTLPESFGTDAYNPYANPFVETFKKFNTTAASEFVPS